MLRCSIPHSTCTGSRSRAPLATRSTYSGTPG
jgi:hypothetical protein